MVVGGVGGSGGSEGGGGGGRDGGSSAHLKVNRSSLAPF